jgi:hypothetical protein
MTRNSKISSNFSIINQRIWFFAGVDVALMMSISNELVQTTDSHNKSLLQLLQTKPTSFKNAGVIVSHWMVIFLTFHFSLFFTYVVFSTPEHSFSDTPEFVCESIICS